MWVVAGQTQEASMQVEKWGQRKPPHEAGGPTE